MLSRIQVALKPELADSFGEAMRKRIKNDLRLPVMSVRTVRVFTVEADINDQQLALAAAGPYSDPVTQDFSTGSLALEKDIDFDWLIEVGFKPGVTDNEGRTAAGALALLIGRDLGDDEKVYTSVQFLIKGDLNHDDAEKIASGLLANTLIQRYTIMTRDELTAAGGVPPQAAKVEAGSGGRVAEIDLDIDDDELMRLSREGVLALSLTEMKFIRDYFSSPDIITEREKVGLSKKICDLELEALAQTWSEHCKHKIFSGNITYENAETGETTTIKSLFDTYIRRPTDEFRQKLATNDWCLSVFKDNAGVVKFNDEWNVAFKAETHNSPSALDPYGGALTGIVGVNRDPFGTGMGARLVANTNVFCFASPFYDKPLPPPLLHPKRVMEGVRMGVEHGGNKSGIPTVNGSLVFDDRYAGKPLVFCGTVGIMPKTVNGHPSEDKKALPGDHIIMTGGRIGKDGIHGATFSSEELNKNSPATAVQIGDPITQKKMFDCLLIARDRGLYTCITDNGAGGLSSSVGEMAQDTGGFELHLDRAPVKYSGLDPWEIFVSEAQERMTLAVAPEKLDEFMELCKKMDVEATDLGTFTDSGKFHILYQGKTIGYMGMDFVHQGLPPMEMKARWQRPRHPEPRLPDSPDLNKTLQKMLARLNICSKEYIVRQYDHEVQGGSVIKPLTGAENDGPSDAAVFRPVLESFEGLVVAHGICPRYSDIDTFHMARAVVDEAVRNAVAVGAGLSRMAGLDNFCWCDPIESDKTPDGQYKLAQLVRTNQGLAEIATAYGVPCISGKDSMKNDFMMAGVKISIPPTLLFSVVAKIDDVRRAVTMDAKRPGDLVYLLGVTRDELGASEYAAMLGAVGNTVPEVDCVTAMTRYVALNRAITSGLVASAHDLSDGGLGVAAAETSFSGGLGMDLDLGQVVNKDVDRDDIILFSESQSRLLVTVRPKDRKEFEAAMNNTIFSRVGEVNGSGRFTVTGKNGGRIIDCDISELKKSWQETLDF